jgi:predicted transcriptional regulator
MKRPTHDEFKKQALTNPIVKAKYERLMLDYPVISELIKARKRANKTQVEIAKAMKTTASVISRIESGGGRKHHSPSLETLKKYANALGCELKIKLVRIDSHR